MTFDTTVSGLTLLKTYQMYRYHRNAGIRSDLVKLFLHDGSLYFALMAAANMINLILFKKIPTNSFLEKSTGNNSVLTHTLSVTIVSRLVLSIRTVGSFDILDPRTTSPQMTTDIHRRSTWIVRDIASSIQPRNDSVLGELPLSCELTSMSKTTGRGTA
ncbi:hypothetical protein BD410DRAFT_796169 [Rickenella mellea]|uniref:Uncharacterized protein n=1 Tax=Rickenella mellea TaxID=50990 RepID=A0A4Y7PM85_9AGAM|nr:hypothetical protein BD410DRAFT_796169 [Rickenella mellea]